MLLFIIFGLDTNAQLDSVVNTLSDRYSKEKNASIKIPYARNVTKYNYIYLDSTLKQIYEYSNLYYYKLMDSLASDKDLIKLTSHESPIIQFYAAFALGKRDTLLLPHIIMKMLDNPVTAGCYSTDVGFNKLSATMIFSSLWERKRETGYPSDLYMDYVDAIYLLHKNALEGDIGVQLVNLRSEALKPTIEILAFEKKNLSAINYIFKWYKAEFYTQLNNVYLEILDSNFVYYYISATKSIIEDLIELNDKKTLQKLGGWLKNNRDKWNGIIGIDKILDKSFEIRDSIKWGQDRYPYSIEEIEFLLGDWSLISGWKIEKYLDVLSDTIVLERVSIKTAKYTKINVGDGTYSSDIIFWTKNNKGKLDKMISCPVIDTKNNRISFGSIDWNWYKIKAVGNKLIIIKEKNN